VVLEIELRVLYLLCLPPSNIKKNVSLLIKKNEKRKIYEIIRVLNIAEHKN
jgi:hypothetical protein